MFPLKKNSELGSQKSAIRNHDAMTVVERFHLHLT